MFLPWTEPVSLAEGRNIRVDLEASLVENDYVWRWTTQIDSADGSGSGLRFEQSQLAGAVVSLSKLRRSASDYVPQLSEDGRLNRRALELMDGDAFPRRDRAPARRRIPAALCPLAAGARLRRQALPGTQPLIPRFLLRCKSTDLAESGTTGCYTRSLWLLRSRPEKLFLVDAMGFVFRAFFAPMARLNSPSGIPTKVPYLFATCCASWRRSTRPTTSPWCSIPGADLPRQTLRQIQGQAPADARGSLRATALRAANVRGHAPADPRISRLRGGRRDRHAGAASGEKKLDVVHRHQRQGHDATGRRKRARAAARRGAGQNRSDRRCRQGRGN